MVDIVFLYVAAGTLSNPVACLCPVVFPDQCQAR